MSDKTTDEIGKSISVMRETLETACTNTKSLDSKVEALSAEKKEAFEKIEADMHKLDEKAQETFLSKTAAENEKKAMEERIENLEGQIVKQTSLNVSKNYKELPEYKAFNALCKATTFATSSIDAEEVKYLRTDVGTQGGFLVPEVLASDILKKIVEISDVRRLSRVRNMSGVKTLNIPIRNTIPTATFEGEAEAATATNSAYESITMTAHRQSVITETTRDILNFSGFDMQSELSSDAITAYAFGEGNKFLLGTGVKQPRGILDDGVGIEEVDSAASGLVSLDDVIQLEGNLKIGYNPVYAFNRKTKVSLRTEKDSNGNYLWKMEGIEQPRTINDHPFVILQDMPDIASDSKSVLFGDFFRGYNILDSVNLELIRDDFTQAAKAKVVFNWHRWLDGQVVLAEAFKILKTKA